VPPSSSSPDALGLRCGTTHSGRAWIYFAWKSRSDKISLTSIIGARRASLKSGLGLTLVEEEGTDLVGHVLVLVR
jgi:hypothetical protein